MQGYVLCSTNSAHNIKLIYVTPVSLGDDETVCYQLVQVGQGHRFNRTQNERSTGLIGRMNDAYIS